MSNVVSITFDAKLAPAVRQFLEAKETIRKVKDEMKGVTDETGRASTAQEKQGSLASRVMKDQIGQLGKMVAGWVGVGAAIQSATALFDQYKARQAAAVNTGQTLGQEILKLRQVAGANGQTAYDQASAAADVTGVSLQSAIRTRTGIERATSGFDQRFKNVGLRESNRDYLAQSSSELQRLYGEPGEEAQYFSLVGEAANNYSGSTATEVTNTINAMLKDGATPEEAQKILRAFNATGGDPEALANALAFTRRTKGKNKTARTAVGLVEKLEKFGSERPKAGEGTRLGRAGIKFGANVTQNISGLADSYRTGQIDDAGLLALGLDQGQILSVQGLAGTGSDSYSSAQKAALADVKNPAWQTDVDLNALRTGMGGDTMTGNEALNIEQNRQERHRLENAGAAARQAGSVIHGRVGSPYYEAAATGYGIPGIGSVTGALEQGLSGSTSVQSADYEENQREAEARKNKAAAIQAGQKAAVATTNLTSGVP